MLRYAITDRKLLGFDEDERRLQLLKQCVRLAREGVDFLQLREKDLPPQELTEVSRRILHAVRAVSTKTKLLVNSHSDVALLIGADGVHVTSGPNQPTPTEIRRQFHATGLPAPFISISCHSLAEVARARDAGFSAILFGPVFGKVVDGVEVVPGVGLEALRSACMTADPIPVLALGGVTEERIADCVAVGAAGVAGIRLFRGNTPSARVFLS